MTTPSGSPSHSRSASISLASMPQPPVDHSANMQALFTQLQALTQQQSQLVQQNQALTDSQSQLAQQNQSLQFQVQQLSSTSSSSSSISAPAFSAASFMPRSYATPNKPPVYSGSGSLSQWTGAIGRWLTAAKVTDGVDQVAQASTFLSPSLGDWWDSVMKKDPPLNWPAMVKKLEDRFQPQVLSKVARSKLDNLRQRAGVVDYHNQFLAISLLITDMSEAEKVHAFKRGLHVRLREKLETGDKEYDTLDSAVSAAALYEDRRRQYMITAFPTVAGRFNNFTAGATAASSSSTSSPMELSHIADSDYGDLWSDSPVVASAAAAAVAAPANVDVTATQVIKQLLNMVQHKGSHGNNSNNRPKGKGLGKLTPEERHKCMKEGRCFKCRQVGHMSNACPSTGTAKPTPQPEK